MKIRCRGYSFKGSTVLPQIFSDIGLKAPMLLVGSETAFDLGGEVIQKRMTETMDKLWDDMSIEDETPMDIEDLPFS